MKKTHSLTSEVYAGLAASFLCSTLAFATEEERFDVSLNIMKPITITSSTDLSFASVVAGSAVSLETDPNDIRALTISAQGEPDVAIVGSVVEEQVTLVTGQGNEGETLLVDSFTFGGDMNKSGVANFNGQGKVDNMRVGATAHVNANNVPGIYRSKATFRLMYL